MICGHIHHAAMHNRFGIHYMNSGDWVRHRHRRNHDGGFELIRWKEAGAPAKVPRRLRRKAVREGEPR